jgi:hypothetical protein
MSPESPDDQPQQTNQAALRQWIDGLAEEYGVDVDDLLIQSCRRDPMYIPYSPNWVGQRCRELADRGLLEHDAENSAYSITEMGRRAAEGSLDTDDLEE